MGDIRQRVKNGTLAAMHAIARLSQPNSAATQKVVEGRKSQEPQAPAPPPQTAQLVSERPPAIATEPEVEHAPEASNTPQGAEPEATPESFNSVTDDELIEAKDAGDPLQEVDSNTEDEAVTAKDTPASAAPVPPPPPPAPPRAAPAPRRNLRGGARAQMRPPATLEVNFTNGPPIVIFGKLPQKRNDRSVQIHLDGPGIIQSHFIVRKKAVGDYSLTAFGKVVYNGELIPRAETIKLTKDGAQLEIGDGIHVSMKIVDTTVIGTGGHGVRADDPTTAVDSIPPVANPPAGPSIPPAAMSSMQKTSELLQQEDEPMDKNVEDKDKAAKEENAPKVDHKVEVKDEPKRGKGADDTQKTKKVDRASFIKGPLGWVFAAVFFVIMLGMISELNRMHSELTAKAKPSAPVAAANVAVPSASVSLPPAPAVAVAATPSATAVAVAAPASASADLKVEVTAPPKLEACAALNADIAKQFLGVENFDPKKLDTTKDAPPGIELCCDKDPQQVADHTLDVSNAGCSLCPTGQCKAS